MAADHRFAAVSLGMTYREEKFGQRAVKAGVRAAKLRHHMLSEEELRALKVQVVPALPRILMVVAGIAALVGAFCGWPWESIGRQFLLGLAGTGFTSFGIFGVRRTVGKVVDAADSVDWIGAILEGIADAIGS